MKPCADRKVTRYQHEDFKEHRLYKTGVEQGTVPLKRASLHRAKKPGPSTAGARKVGGGSKVNAKAIIKTALQLNKNPRPKMLESVLKTPTSGRAVQPRGSNFAEFQDTRNQHNASTQRRQSQNPMGNSHSQHYSPKCGNESDHRNSCKRGLRSESKVLERKENRNRAPWISSPRQASSDQLRFSPPGKRLHSKHNTNDNHPNLHHYAGKHAPLTLKEVGTFFEPIKRM